MFSDSFRESSTSGICPSPSAAVRARRFQRGTQRGTCTPTYLAAAQATTMAHERDPLRLMRTLNPCAAPDLWTIARRVNRPSDRPLGAAVFNKARVIKDLGNLAVHSERPVRQFDALTATTE